LYKFRETRHLGRVLVLSDYQENAYFAVYANTARIE